MPSDTFTLNRPHAVRPEANEGATILPFRRPARLPAPDAAPAPASQQQASPMAPVTPAAQDPQARLAAALARLQSALEDQRAAIAQWRSTIGTLRGSIGTLGVSLEGYRNKLATLGHEVGQLNGDARALESWADQAIARSAQATASDKTP